MSLTSAQIVTQAATIAKATGSLAIAGQMLNSILSELCQDYDFDLARGTVQITLNPASVTTAQYPNNTPGSGPYNLPADFLRCERREFMYYISGTPYPMIHVDLWEYDQAVQQAGFQSYPYVFATDMEVSPPVAIVWPPSSGAYQLNLRYRRQMPDIATPETSTTVPWFPNTNYLVTRLAGELMKATSDARWMEFLGDSAAGAEGILRKYLIMKDDSADRAKSVKLDDRRFGSQFNRLPNTKKVGF